MKKIKSALMTAILLFSLVTQAQVGIGVATANINPAAQLDVSSTNKGFLPPRMTEAQRNTIPVTPASAGLVVYCTNCGIRGEMQYYNGSAWTNMMGGAAKDSSDVLTLAITTAASNITSTSAKSGGYVISDGGDAINAMGLCWSTSQNPTIADATTSIAGTTGIFTHNLTGLSPATTYYVRAYATNSMGTIYGAQISFTTNDLSLAIGDTYGGGKVAYILQPGDPGYIPGQVHGLIAAVSDLIYDDGYSSSNNIRWSNGGGGLPNAPGEAIGTGLANTNAIIESHQGSNASTYAAGLCRAYQGGGYTDWYLPSKDELTQLIINRNLIGGFDNVAYWSSTEHDYEKAWTNNLENYNYPLYKFYNFIHVRAVRSF